ncbi:hypothetical protein FB451DRAFT_1204131 [Mycena latifolia]|nr:hypothetical protein FB451DRAFT_1204131 [Mycena latifolia]
MPRILPRLIKLPLSGHFPSPRRTPVLSLRKPVSPLPSALPADYPRSVLLSPGNIITNSHDYVRHKSMPPVHRMGRRKTPRDQLEYDPPREMSAQERIWWSSPYLRMLASPIRQCFFTERYLPADFMIRLTPMRVPRAFQQSKFPLVLVPDGIQHPKFKRRKAGRGVYVGCWRETLAGLLSRGKYKRFGATAPPRLAQQIGHLLRLRVLQELQLIAKQLEALYRTRTGPASMRSPIVNRLTRAEWDLLKTTGTLPRPGALAVLVVPPVNRDPTTKQRPPTAGAMSAAPPVDPSQPPLRPKRELPPLCVLHRTSAPAPTSPVSEHHLDPSEYWEQKLRERASVGRAFVSPLDAGSFMASLTPSRDAENGKTREVRTAPHAEERVPLYNGVPLFPQRVQRARLHALLTRILGVEGAWRFSAGARSQQGSDRRAAQKSDSKRSHAFLICASDEVDVAPLGVALWRVRMWEGGGWKKRSTDGTKIKEEREKKEPWPWPWVQEPPSS